MAELEIINYGSISADIHKKMQKTLDKQLKKMKEEVSLSMTHLLDSQKTKYLMGDSTIPILDEETIERKKDEFTKVINSSHTATIINNRGVLCASAKSGNIIKCICSNKIHHNNTEYIYESIVKENIIFWESFQWLDTPKKSRSGAYTYKTNKYVYIILENGTCIIFELLYGSYPPHQGMHLYKYIESSIHIPFTIIKIIKETYNIILNTNKYKIMGFDGYIGQVGTDRNGSRPNKILPIVTDFNTFLEKTIIDIRDNYMDLFCNSPFVMKLNKKEKKLSIELEKLNLLKEKYEDIDATTLKIEVDKQFLEEKNSKFERERAKFEKEKELVLKQRNEALQLNSDTRRRETNINKMLRSICDIKCKRCFGYGTISRKICRDCAGAGLASTSRFLYNVQYEKKKLLKIKKDIENELIDLEQEKEILRREKFKLEEVKHFDKKRISMTIVSSDKEYTYDELEERFHNLSIGTKSI